MTDSKIQKTRIDNKWPIAREGMPFFIVGLIACLIFFVAGLPVPGFIMVFLSLFTLFFFRDPERTCFADEKTILVPADGKILEIRPLKSTESPMATPSIKVSIFMSLFNVHVNRIPVYGKINSIAYNPGKFFSANLDKASEQNEKNLITMLTKSGHKIVFVQIAGFIARRIVCWIKESDDVKSGQRFGLIRFGSRLDVYLPDNSRIVVNKHQKVKAGETVLGYLP